MASLLVAFLALAPAPPIGAAPPPAAPLPDGVLAVVGDETITVAAFEQEMARRGGGLPGQYATPEQRRALLDELIEFRAFAARARADGLDRDPQLVAAFDRLLVARYKDERLKPELGKLTVSEGEIQSFYEQHKKEYAVPERLRAAIVRIGVPGTTWSVIAVPASRHDSSGRACGTSGQQRIRNLPAARRGSRAEDGLMSE